MLELDAVIQRVERVVRLEKTRVDMHDTDAHLEHRSLIAIYGGHKDVRLDDKRGYWAKTPRAPQHNATSVEEFDLQSDSEVDMDWWMERGAIDWLRGEPHTKLGYRRDQSRVLALHLAVEGPNTTMFSMYVFVASL